MTPTFNNTANTPPSFLRGVDLATTFAQQQTPLGLLSPAAVLARPQYINSVATTRPVGKSVRIGKQYIQAVKYFQAYDEAVSLSDYAALDNKYQALYHSNYNLDKRYEACKHELAAAKHENARLKKRNKELELQKKRAQANNRQTRMRLMQLRKAAAAALAPVYNLQDHQASTLIDPC